MKTPSQKKHQTIADHTVGNVADNDKYFVSTSSLLEGIKPEEMDKYAEIAVQAASSRAIDTRQGGLNSGSR